MNLLHNRWIARIAKNRFFPLVLQLLTLLAFGLLIAGGIAVTTDDSAFAKVLRNTNLANLVVWSYWWPLIILSAVLLGRFWCTVCPMELLTYLTCRIGRKRRSPKLLKSGWIITIFYAAILLLGVHTFAIHRVPRRMALYLLLLLAVALLTSLIYDKRAFCSYVCPVGHLLGLYALVSPLQWRAKDPSVCSKCPGKDCVTKKNRYRLSGRSCTSNLYPATIKDNRQCLLCTQCFKACPYDNLQLATRRPFADLMHSLRFSTAQIAFMLLVCGFVVYEVLSEWSPSKALLLWLPNQLANSLHLAGSLRGFVSAVIMFVVLPVGLFALVCAVVKALTGTRPQTTANALVFVLLPTVTGAHVIKAILKMTSRIPYWPYALRDPAGLTTAQKIMAKTLTLDSSTTTALAPFVTAVAVIILLLSFLAILSILRRSQALASLTTSTKAVLLLAATAYWALFAVTIFLWRF